MTLEELAKFVSDMQNLDLEKRSLQVEVDSVKAALEAAARTSSAEILRLRGEITPSWKMKADRVISAGKALMAIDVPYDHGGNNYLGIDCSRLMQVIFNTVGVKLPRVSDDQRKLGTEVQLADIRLGDLIAFNRLGGNDGVYDHIGVFAGNGLMLHTAGNPEGINLCDWAVRYKDVLYTIRRVL